MDRRKHVRVNFKKEIIYNDRQTEFMASTANISGAGVFINTKTILPIGAMLDLTINDDDHGRILTLSGHVSRIVEGQGMAVQYIQPTHLLNSIIAKAAPI